MTDRPKLDSNQADWPPRILSAKQVFTYQLYGAMRSLGITAQKNRRTLCMIDGKETHFVDFALPGHFDRFEDYKAAILRRAANKKAHRGRP